MHTATLAHAICNIIVISYPMKLILIQLFLFLQVNRPLTMKKEGIQTRKRKPKNSQGPMKELKSSKNISSATNMQQNMQALVSSHQYVSYDSTRDVSTKTMLNYDAGTLFEQTYATI